MTQLGIDVKVKAAEEFTEKADVEPLDEEEEIEQEVRSRSPARAALADVVR